MRRMLLVLAVMAVMAALLVAIAVPAFAQGAEVTPKEERCSEREFEDVSERLCVHDVLTPSGNNNGHSTYEISYPGVDERFKDNYHFKPA